jgi:hypothetical protein
VPAPRLLGAFEPLLLGWESRSFVVGDAEPRIVSGGVFRPLVLARGLAVGTWAISPRGVATELFGRLTRVERTALDGDAADVTRFLGS